MVGHPFLPTILLVGTVACCYTSVIYGTVEISLKSSKRQPMVQFRSARISDAIKFIIMHECNAIMSSMHWSEAKRSTITLAVVIYTTEHCRCCAQEKDGLTETPGTSQKWLAKRWEIGKSDVWIIDRNKGKIGFAFRHVCPLATWQNELNPRNPQSGSHPLKFRNRSWLLLGLNGTSFSFLFTVYCGQWIPAVTDSRRFIFASNCNLF